MSRSIRLRFSAGRPLLNLEDYRRAARRALPGMVWDYIDGGADDLVTLRENRRGFQHWDLVPRVLTGVGEVDTSLEFASSQLSVPVLLAPTGLSGLANWRGELALARAAESAGTRAVVSTAASYTPEEVAAGTASAHYFQLYPWAGESDARAFTDEVIDRVGAAGYRALFVTVDTAAMGNREGESRRGMGVPPTITPWRALDAAARPRWSVNFLRHRRISARILDSGVGLAAGVRSVERQMRMMRPDLRWSDFEHVRSRWNGPLYVKGILAADDAKRAVDLGADGVVVSNHGGRQLDSAQASVRALPAIVAAVGSHAQVLLDGGVRRGTDIAKALCLGATAVLIGRPHLYGLAVDGENGVRGVLDLLASELRRTMTLLGAPTLADLDQSFIAQRYEPVAEP